MVHIKAACLGLKSGFVWRALPLRANGILHQRTPNNVHSKLLRYGELSGQKSDDLVHASRAVMCAKFRQISRGMRPEGKILPLVESGMYYKTEDKKYGRRCT